jgi:hypothetical protein
MQAAEELPQSFARRLSRASSTSSEMTTSDPISGSLFAIIEEDFLDWLNRHVSTTATTPLAARKQPDRERVRQAAIELWGTAGPPEHLSNSLIWREVAEWLKKNGQAADISDVTILRAVGRK